jgi:hypothetical protein
VKRIVAFALFCIIAIGPTFAAAQKPLPQDYQSQKKLQRKLAKKDAKTKKKLQRRINRQNKKAAKDYKKHHPSTS